MLWILLLYPSDFRALSLIREQGKQRKVLCNLDALVTLMHLSIQILLIKHYLGIKSLYFEVNRNNSLNLMKECSKVRRSAILDIANKICCW